MIVSVGRQTVAAVLAAVAVGAAVLPPAAMGSPTAEYGGAHLYASRAAQSDDEMVYLGLSLATVDAAGRWTGRWIGAHPLARDGATYVVAIAAASWATLQAALGTLDAGSVYLLGDLPYAGDSVCAPGATRRWWLNGVLGADGLSMDWQPTAVPTSAPALSCPTNSLSDGPLLLRVLGAVPAP